MSKILKDFWDYVDKSGECWLWTGTVQTSKRGGYGLYGTLLAHRVAWRLVNGPIPEGKILHHKKPPCTSKLCVRPGHLEPVEKDEHPDFANKNRTHCVNGHEFTTANTAFEKNGENTVRRCIACRRRRGRNRSVKGLIERMKT